MVERTQIANMVDDSTESDLSLEAVHAQQFNQSWVVTRPTNVWRPPTDVFEMGNKLVVMVEIAGMRDAEFSVALQERRLVISGTRQRVVQDRLNFHQMEVRYGEFRTAVSLPFPVERSKVSATYKDGFLRVELPRAASQQVHIVNVDVEQDSQRKSDG